MHLSTVRRLILTQSSIKASLFFVLCQVHNGLSVFVSLLYFSLSLTQSLRYTLSWRHVTTNKQSSCYCGENQYGSETVTKSD